MRRSSWRPLVERSWVEGPHWASRTWTPRTWSNWTERTLNLLFNKLLGMVNLLRGSPDDEEFEVRVPIWWELPRDLHKGACLLIYGFHILPTSANDQPTLVSWNGESHLSTRRPPVALASASASTSRGHAWAPGRSWGTTP